MRANVQWSGTALVASGLAIFLWKLLVLGLPVVPTDPEGLWRVELEVKTRGSGSRGSISTALPTTEPGQLVSDERVLSDQLLFTIRTAEEQRVGVWSGSVEKVQNVTHGFRVQLTARRTPFPEHATPSSTELTSKHLAPTPQLPSSSQEIADTLETLRFSGAESVVVTLRTLFAFVADEIALVEGESDDALLTLSTREGSPLGKARLLATLLRSAGIPARTVHGLSLSEGRDPQVASWVEASVSDRWIPMSPSEGFFAELPGDIVAMHRDDPDLVRGVGVAALAFRYRAIRERHSAEEVATLMEPASPAFAGLSLYRLPVATQSALRLLLLIPLGALAMALMRNVVGVPSFGTFLPVLLALALRGSELAPGLTMIAAVVFAGVITRLWLDRLHLLLVPRLCILLCTVVLTVSAFALVGIGIESRSLFGGVLLPIVILSMLIERFSIAVAEEGTRPAMVRLGWTALVATCIYPLFRSEFLETLFFGFPELVFSVMGALVFVGGYTGFRIFELVRFRAFAQATPGANA